MRTKDLHLYLLDMSQLCYYYINPHMYFFFKKKINKSICLNKHYIAPTGIEPMHMMMKTSCLNHLTIRPSLCEARNISPVQVSRLLQLVTKQLHYFYANQARYKVYKVVILIIFSYI